MMIQFTLPDEYVAAAKVMITMVDPSNTEPTNADVLAYVARSLVAGMTSLFPGVVLAVNAAAAAQIADLAAGAMAATATAMDVQVVA